MNGFLPAIEFEQIIFVSFKDASCLIGDLKDRLFPKISAEDCIQYVVQF